MFTISTGWADSLKKSQNTTFNEFTFGGTERSAVVVVTKNVRNFLFVWAHVTVRKTLFSIPAIFASD